jgi:hypothetical protein
VAGIDKTAESLKTMAGRKAQGILGDPPPAAVWAG